MWDIIIPHYATDKVHNTHGQTIIVFISYAINQKIYLIANYVGCRTIAQ